MARLPRRDAAPPGEDVPAIVAAIESVADPGERRHARLRLRDDELVYRLWARRLRRRERIADGLSKYVGGSLLTSSAALLLSGRVDRWTVGMAVTALFLFAIGAMLAAAGEYQGAAWESEADRIAAALDELRRQV